VADTELELAHGLDEGSRLNVTNGTTKLHVSSVTVPRLTSTMQTSGSSPVSSAEVLATRSTQSWTALVRWGTIWTVLPR
jgi:hypothetical protein